MNTDTVRLNITIPRPLAQQLEKMTGPRKRSQFIAEALKQRIEQLQKQELEKLLTEGYQATKKESLELTKEFKSIDLEGWDDY